ncbi:MAG: LLM class flavin-dependent oxidoreductase [Thermomicrobiales bacterium]|nr:LLM class flavin-dependent oxidoreductase [Thermomicrobiales bacterium]
MQIIGMIRTDNASEIDNAVAQTVEGVIDRDFVREFAQAHEEAGFDRVLIGFHSTGPDGWLVAAHAAAHTRNLHMLIAHRPGFLAPTVAARAAVSFDHFSGGRCSLNIVTGGSDADLARDGDWTLKDTRYQRTDEFLDIARGVWNSETPFDYDGDFYKVKGAFSDVKPLQPGGIPIYFAGASGPAVSVGAKHADVYMFWGEPLADIAARMAAVRAAAPAGRSPAFSVSVRPITGQTEKEAWEKAHHYLERVVAHKGQAPGSAPAAGSQRLLDRAKEQEVFDDRLWLAISAATGAPGNTSCLVGTTEQVAEAILRYHDLGVDSILIRGFEPLEDVREWGHDLIPRIREGAATRASATRAAD